MAVESSYVFSGDEDKESLRRRRRLAEALMAKGMDTSPIGSPWQGAARMATGLIGGLMAGSEDKRDREREAAVSAHNAGVLPALLGGGGAPSPGSGEGVPSGQPIKLGGFDPSMGRVFEFEGGLNPRDTNGTPSKFGINAKANPDVNLDTLTREQAAGLYRDRYWNAIGADKMDPRLAHVAFDTAVIAGPGKANELLQASGGDPEKFLMLRKQFQDRLIARDPEKYGPYAKAWSNRIATLGSDIGARPGGMFAMGSGQQTLQGGDTLEGSQPVRVADASGRIQQLYAIAANPMTNATNKALAMNEIKRLQEANDPTKALQRQSLELDIQQKRRALAGEGAVPLTPEERTKFGVREGQPAFRTRSGDIKFGPVGTSVNVNTGQPTDQEFYKELDKKSATRWDKYFDRGDQAQAMMGDLNQLREISRAVGQQGAAVNVKAALGPYAEALGIDVSGLSDIQTFESIVQRLAPQLREPGSGSTSDIEFKGFLKSIGPLSNNPLARERIIDTFEAFARHDMARAEIASKVRSREITLSEAEKQMRALPDPLTAFRQFKKENPDAFKGGPAAPAPSPAAPAPAPQNKGGFKILKVE